VAEYNNIGSVKQLFEACPDEIAAVIVEPVAGNMGVVPPLPGFLAELRQLTRANDALLIFDEIISGFRVAYGGAQELFGIQPDITTLGKIIGGGLPVGAYGGSRDIMSNIAPTGAVYQAGTLSGNPVAMTAGIETLRLLQQADSYPHLERLAAMLSEGLGAAAGKAGIPVYQTRVGSLMGMFFTDDQVVNFTTAKTSDTARYGRYFHAMLEAGSYFAPSQFEAAFVSLAHDDSDIRTTIAAAEKVMSVLE
jgi:glutamate-1-semialdehyde 2,1-aminomutase